MKRFVMLALVALSLVSLGLTSATRAASEVYQFRGRIAEANFLSKDASGCVVTDVFLRAFGEGTAQPGNTPTRPAVAVQLTRYNVCDEGPSLISADGFAWLGADELQIDRHLSASSLRTTIDLYDVVSQTPLPVAIDITWIGNGDTITGRDRTHFHIRQTNFLVIESFAETIRLGEARGSVIVRGENATPTPAWDAKLATRTTSELTVSR